MEFAGGIAKKLPLTVNKSPTVNKIKSKNKEQE
jgi:hypothetical protein